MLMLIIIQHNVQSPFFLGSNTMATMERFIYASPVPIVPIPIDLDISTDTASKKIDIN